MGDERHLIERIESWVQRTRWNGWTNESFSGELLTMRDGSVWFHPYSGSAPIKEKGAASERTD